MLGEWDPRYCASSQNPSCKPYQYNMVLSLIFHCLHLENVELNDQISTETFKIHVLV